VIIALVQDVLVDAIAALNVKGEAKASPLFKILRTQMKK